MSSLSLGDDLATVGVLWRRDLARFFRQRSRLAGALVQPIVFWLLIGGGMASTFQLGTAPGLGYMEYFYPGIVVMMVLFASIFGTITVIEDRHAGFLQSVIVGPGSRTALVLGKSLGVGSVGLLQSLLFLAFAPWAGFAFGDVSWASIALFLLAGAVGLSAFGFALAWLLDSSQAYHAVMSVVLLPAWVLSGAMFPASTDHAVLAGIMRVNPMTYLVSGVRRALYGGSLPTGTSPVGSAAVEVAVALGFAAAAVALATFVCHRRR